MRSMVVFELIKLALTYLIVKVIFEFIDAASDLARLLSRIARRFPHCLHHRLCGRIIDKTSGRKIRRAHLLHVYPNARFVQRENETCTICLETNTNVVLQCGHSYHWECVNGWLDVKNTCPVCRYLVFGSSDFLHLTDGFVSKDATAKVGGAMDRRAVFECSGYLNPSEKHSSMIRLTLFILLCSLCLAALPPGYEEELYCPPDSCLKRKERPPGWSGPRSYFHECCNQATGTTRAPHSWGKKVAQSVKDELILNKWHMTKCAQQDGQCKKPGEDTRGSNVHYHHALERLVDRLMPLYQSRVA